MTARTAAKQTPARDNAAAQLRIEQVPVGESFAWVRALCRSVVFALRRRYFRYCAAVVAQALERGGRAAVIAAAPEWRARARRFDMPSASAMNQILDGLRIAPASETEVAAAWIESDAFDQEAILIYVPGGSFVVGRTPQLTALIARIAKATRVKACIVDYRLAPEHPCPAAVEDIEHAIRDLIGHGRRGEDIALVAESSGAAIALSAAMRLRDDAINLSCLCFLSPWTDLALTGLSAVTRPLANKSSMALEVPALCAHLYLQGISPVDPVGSPVYGDLRGLPPMLIHTSKSDALHDDARMLAERAFRAGTDVTLRIWQHGQHAFEQRFDSQAERAIADVALFLRTRLNLSLEASEGR